MSFTLALKLVMSTCWKRSCFRAQSLHPFADKKTCHWSKHNDCVGPHSVLQGLYVPLPVWSICRGRGGDWVVRNGKEGCMQGRWWESDTGWRMWETFYLRKWFLWPKRVAFLACRKIYVWWPKSNSWEGCDNTRCWTVPNSALFFASLPLMEALLPRTYLEKWPGAQAGA